MIDPIGSQNTLLEVIDLTGPSAPLNQSDIIALDNILYHGSDFYSTVDSFSSGEYYPTRCESALNVSKDIFLRDESLSERLERIETMLNIPTRDIDMETKHPRLKQLFEEYMQELDKLKTWKKLND